MSTTTNTKGFATGSVLLALAVIAAASVNAALLYLSCGAGVLLVTALVVQLLRPLSGPTRALSAMLLSAALAAALRLLLAATAPGWLQDMGHELLYYSVFLLCGGTAAALAEREVTLPFGRYALFGALMLVTGAVRELLAGGTLLGLRLLDKGVSADFGRGAAGVIVAGLLLALFGVRERHVFHGGMKEGVCAAIAVTLTTLCAGLVYTVVTILLPSSEMLEPLPAVLFSGLAALAGRALFRGMMLRPFFEDETLLAVSVITLLLVRPAADGWGNLWVPLCAALAAGGVLLVFGAIYPRIDNTDLPAPFRTTPALVVVAGTALLALSVIRF